MEFKAEQSSRNQYYVCFWQFICFCFGIKIQSKRKLDLALCTNKTKHLDISSVKQCLRGTKVENKPNHTHTPNQTHTLNKRLCARLYTMSVVLFYSSSKICFYFSFLHFKMRNLQLEHLNNLIDFLCLLFFSFQFFAFLLSRLVRLTKAVSKHKFNTSIPIFQLNFFSIWIEHFDQTTSLKCDQFEMEL